MKGFSLLEVLVVLIIVAVLTAIALPYYRNAVESSRMTEVVILWGQQKNWANGYNMSTEQAQKATERLQKAPLKYYTGQVICREKEDATQLCWEAEFSQRNEDASLRYKLVTTHNFSRLACIGLNHAGENFCESQSRQEPYEENGEKIYEIR